MANQNQGLSRVFHALADPTRRAVIERLSAGPTATTELAAPFPMALPSFAQHLEVLESCGLVRSQKRGRVRTYQLAPGFLRMAEDWLTEQRSRWECRRNPQGTQTDDKACQLVTMGGRPPEATQRPGPRNH